MNITLTVVVSAIVILITALVVITIFGGGISQVGSISESRTLCMTQCDTTCRATKSIPITWSAPTVKNDAGASISCEEALGGTPACGQDGKCSTPS